MPQPARMLTVGGETRSIEEWATLRGLAVATIRCRLDRLKWEAERAVNTPADRRFRKGGRKPAGAPHPCPPLRPHPGGQAVVRWRANGARHSRYMGPWGSDEAAAAYQRFQAEWAAGQIHAAGSVDGLGVAELVQRWLAWCEGEYRKGGGITSEVHCCRAASAVLVALYGPNPAAEFGPLELRAVRAAMVKKKWARRTINLHCSRVVRCFKWGAGFGLVPAAVWQALTAVEWLKAGRSEAREPGKKKPADPDTVLKTLRHLSPDPKRRAVLADMIAAQQLTGMRPGEVCEMRAGDIDRSADVWVYTVRPEVNKNEHRDKPQRYYLGPRAQEVIRRHLDGAGEAGRVFRLPPRGTPVSRNYYGLSIRLACDAAGVKRWAPHQLRHSLATEVARRYSSMDHAAAAIGDTAATAAAVYVHLDPDEKAKIDIARAMG